MLIYVQTHGWHKMQPTKALFNVRTFGGLFYIFHGNVKHFKFLIF